MIHANGAVQQTFSGWIQGFRDHVQTLASHLASVLYIHHVEQLFAVAVKHFDIAKRKM